MRKRMDMIGKKFGRLTVIDYYGVKKHHAQWLCQCECGLTTLAYAYQLNNGKKQSCGCLRIEKAMEHIPPAKKGKDNPTYKHGGKSGGPSRLYTAWWNMLKRCETPSANRYYCYGARGISVCKEWHDFKVFQDWAFANGYQEQPKDTPRSQVLSIDRIDPDGHYEPGNCRWVTVSENSTSRNLHANQR